MKPTTAVIFAAGTGTRFLPVTSAIQKELLPILNRPVVDYLVADLVAAGVTRIIFVIRPGATGLKEFYLGNPDYEAALERLGKPAALEQLRTVHNQAKFEFVEQPDDAGYGTAIPLRLAMPLLSEDETIVVSSGDDFVWRADGSSEMKAFVDKFAKSGAEGGIMSLMLPATAAQAYGVLDTAYHRGGEYLTGISEKPKPGPESTRLTNISKYILNGAQREFVLELKPNPTTGEYYITDAIVAASAEHPIVVHRISGTYLDTGNPAAWLHANEVVAADSTASNK